MPSENANTPELDRSLEVHKAALEGKTEKKTAADLYNTFKSALNQATDTFNTEISKFELLKSEDKEEIISKVDSLLHDKVLLLSAEISNIDAQKNGDIDAAIQQKHDTALNNIYTNLSGIGRDLEQAGYTSTGITEIFSPDIGKKEVGEIVTKIENTEKTAESELSKKSTGISALDTLRDEKMSKDKVAPKVALISAIGELGANGKLHYDDAIKVAKKFGILEEVKAMKSQFDNAIKNAQSILGRVLFKNDTAQDLTTILSNNGSPANIKFRDDLKTELAKINGIRVGAFDISVPAGKLTIPVTIPPALKETATTTLTFTIVNTQKDVSVKCGDQQLAGNFLTPQDVIRNIKDFVEKKINEQAENAKKEQEEIAKKEEQKKINEARKGAKKFLKDGKIDFQGDDISKNAVGLHHIFPEKDVGFLEITDKNNNKLVLQRGADGKFYESILNQDQNAVASFKPSQNRFLIWGGETVKQITPDQATAALIGPKKKGEIISPAPQESMSRLQEIEKKFLTVMPDANVTGASISENGTTKPISLSIKFKLGGSEFSLDAEGEDEQSLINQLNEKALALKTQLDNVKKQLKTNILEIANKAGYRFAGNLEKDFTIYKFSKDNSKQELAVIGNYYPNEENPYVLHYATTNQSQTEIGRFKTNEERLNFILSKPKFQKGNTTA